MFAVEKKTLVWVTMLILGWAGSAVAQSGRMPNTGPGGPPARPSFSPYLNLTRPGGSPGLNYYGLVRPQNQADQSIQQLQLAAGSPANVPTSLNGPNTGITTTGTAFGFHTYRTYFQNQYNFAGFGNVGNNGMNQGGMIGAGGLNPYLSGNRLFQNLTQPPGPQIGPPRSR